MPWGTVEPLPPPTRPLPRRALGSGTGARLRAVAVALPLAMLALAGLWSWVDVRADLRADIARDMTLLRAQILRSLDVQESVLAAVGVATAGLSWPEIHDSRLVHHLLVRLAVAADAVDTVSLVGPDGHVAASSDLAFPARPIDLSDRDFVRAFPRGARAEASFVGQAVSSRVDGITEIHLARPRVRNPGEQATGDGGELVAGFRPGLFETLFAQVAPSPHSAIVLARRDGSLLARFPNPVAPGRAAMLAPDDPIAMELRQLPSGDTLQLEHARFCAAQRIAAYDLVLAMDLDPAVAGTAWARQMLFPTLGAVATAALLLLLAHRAQLRLEAEAEQMRQHTARVEAEREAAQERARLEARLRQTERHAALGQLAAGVSHDFNNLLQTVMVGADSLLRPPATAERTANAARLVLRAAERGIALTRRMLDFARADEAGPDAAAPGSFAVDAVLASAQDLLSHLLGKRWPVTLEPLPATLPPVRGDPAECEAVLMNLAVNARDAMPEGGTIVLRAGMSRPPAALPHLTAQECVWIEVRDKGCGMDPATLARAGEAFFTTKPRGLGTGLGLSMARGFAQRSGGTLAIASVRGEGTTVTLWLVPA